MVKRFNSSSGKYISKKIGNAIGEYNMIKEGDKILIAVSGGKDSLVLLDMLVKRLEFAPIKYELHALYVNSNFNNEPNKCLELKKMFKKYKVNYTIKNMEIEVKEGKTNCFWCSWNRRKVLFDYADEIGYDKIALGHHKDDIVETILMNMFFIGDFSTMNPYQELFEGKIKLIRPLVYCDESIIAEYAKENNLIIEEKKCAYSGDSKRHYVKKLIKDLEHILPSVKTNIYRSMTRIRQDYIDLR